jgi:arylsulfatase A-like enzyme
MRAALLGLPQPGHQFLYWEFHERGFQQAVRMGRWKAVRLAAGAPLALYDLEADPREERDVAAAHPGIVKVIEAYLQTARTPSQRWPGA